MTVFLACVGSCVQVGSVLQLYPDSHVRSTRVHYRRITDYYADHAQSTGWRAGPCDTLPPESTLWVCTLEYYRTYSTVTIMIPPWQLVVFQFRGWRVRYVVRIL